MADLLHGGQALKLRRAQAVLLLQGSCLQHQMLLLGGVHLLQVLRCCVRLSVQCLLKHLHTSTHAEEQLVNKTWCIVND